MASPRSRRDVLALSATALLSFAGCVGDDTAADSSATTSPPVSATTTDRDSATTTDETTEPTTDHGNYRHIEITVNPADPAEVADAMVRQFSDLSARQRRVVSSSVADGEHVYTTYVEKPLEDGTYVAYDGAYYRVRVTVAAQHQRTGHSFRLEAVSDCEHRLDDEELETAREKAVGFADLPPADRKAFAFTHEDDLREDVCFSAGYHYVYESESAVAESVLVSDDPTYVEYRDEIYVVEFRETVPVTEYDYRYTVERVATTEAELHDVMVREVAIHLRPGDLSTAERDLLAELTKTPSHEEWKNPIPRTVDDLLERIRSHDSHGKWSRYYVAYRGELYEFTIEEAVA